MKIPFAVAVLILALGAGFGWHNYLKIVAARETHGRLVAKAATLGITAEPTRPGDPGRITKRGRENHEMDARLVAAGFIALAKEMEAFEEKNGELDEAMEKRRADFDLRMMTLDFAQMQILIAEVRANTDLKDDSRQGLIIKAIITLADDHPQAAVALFAESSDLFKDRAAGTLVISSALARWAKDDPMAALAWLRENAGTYPDAINDDVKRRMLNGTAANDPKLAFKLIGELGGKDSNNALDEIVRAARTPEARTAMLAALREHLATIKDEEARNDTAQRTMRRLAQDATREGFASCSQWLATANLSPAELTSVANGVYYNSSKSGETGQWVEWMGTSLAADKAESRIKNLVSRWTADDYQAVGSWLAATPGGPTKNTAIRGYAETISRYEPATAAQWALTLPAGPERLATLRQIYRNWPRTDAASSAAAAAFAAQHGIE